MRRKIILLNDAYSDVLLVLHASENCIGSCFCARVDEGSLECVPDIARALRGETSAFIEERTINANNLSPRGNAVSGSFV